MTLYIHWYKLQGKTIQWNESKDAWLKQVRGIGFPDVIEALAGNNLLWMVDHPHPERHPGQKVLAVAMKGYVYIVPCEVQNETIELKTI